MQSFLSLPLCFRVAVPPNTHPLWRQRSRFITCEICCPFLHFLTAPVYTHTATTRPHPITHTHTHTNLTLFPPPHSSVCHWLSVAKLQSRIFFFNHSLLLTLFLRGFLCCLKIAVLCFYGYHMLSALCFYLHMDLPSRLLDAWESGLRWFNYLPYSENEAL